MTSYFPSQGIVEAFWVILGFQVHIPSQKVEELHKFGASYEKGTQNESFKHVALDNLCKLYPVSSL